MSKTIKVIISNKEDYFTTMGEEDEIEEYCDENGIDFYEFLNLQQSINEKPDRFKLTVSDDEFEEFMDYCNSDGEVISSGSKYTVTVDPSIKVLDLISNKLGSKYDLEIESFDIEIVEL